MRNCWINYDCGTFKARYVYSSTTSVSVDVEGQKGNNNFFSSLAHVKLFPLNEPLMWASCWEAHISDTNKSPPDLAVMAVRRRKDFSTSSREVKMDATG